MTKSDPHDRVVEAQVAPAADLTLKVDVAVPVKVGPVKVGPVKVVQVKVVQVLGPDKADLVVASKLSWLDSIRTKTASFKRTKCRVGWAIWLRKRTPTRTASSIKRNSRN